MRARPVLVLGAVVVFSVAVVVVVAAVARDQRRGAPAAAYSPQLDRIASWDLPTVGTPIGSGQVPYLANRGSMTFLNPAAPGFDISQHFTAARQLVAASPGHRLRVFDYFNVSYWYNSNYAGLAPYSAGFSRDWLLRDASGRPIAYDPDPRARAINRPRAYLMDLSNAALRRWIVATVVSWMHGAPYSGVVFDSADALSGQYPRGSVADGRTPFNALLCGAPSADCARVDSWNAGLVELMASATAALRRLGDRTLYNGIAPSPQRGPSRNLGLLAQTGGATNETFCYGPALGRKSTNPYQPVAADAAIMRAAAASHKVVLEITNYANNTSPELAAYCAAAFLIGWQPGSSYQIYHRAYDDLGDARPVSSPEMNLNLGNPTEVGYARSGTVLSRSFDNGFVAVNTGPSPRSVVAPFAAQRFSGGRSVGHVDAGRPLAVDGHAGVFLLRDRFLRRSLFPGD